MLYMMTGACLKGRKGLVTLLVGTVLGLSLGCALTLTYSIKLSSGVSYREDFDRLPRMALESTDKTRLDIVQVSCTIDTKSIKVFKYLSPSFYCRKIVSHLHSTPLLLHLT